MPERSFSTYQLADLLGVTAGEVATWMDKGWLGYRKIDGGTVRVSETQLVAFLKEQGIDINMILTSAAPGASAADIAERYPSPQLSQPAQQPARANQPVAAKLDVEQVANEALWTPIALPPMELAQSDAIEESPVDSSDIGQEVPPEPMQEMPAELPQEAAAARYVPAPVPPPATVSVAAAGEPAGQVANAILRDAIARGAQAIHLEPRGDGLSLRLRVDGVLYDKANFQARLPERIAPKLIETLCRQAGLSGSAGSGSFMMDYDGRAVAVTLSAVAVDAGSRIVLTLDDPHRRPARLEQLGLAPAQMESLSSLLAKPTGLVVLANAPRSGMDAVMAAMLSHVNTRGRNVVAFGAWDIAGVNSIAATADASAIASLAGQDVDVLLIDQLRRPEAAVAAMLAAKAGALVLAGVRRSDCAAALATFAEFACDGWELSWDFAGALAVRQMRRLCQECKEQALPADDAIREMNLPPGALAGPIASPRGCGRCDHTGYMGTSWLIETLPADRATLSSLRQGADEGTLRQSQQASLLWAGLDLVRQGVTSLEELLRVLPQ